jgi:hypothetical protein
MHMHAKEDMYEEGILVPEKNREGRRRFVEHPDAKARFLKRGHFTKPSMVPYDHALWSDLHGPFPKPLTIAGPLLEYGPFIDKLTPNELGLLTKGIMVTEIVEMDGGLVWRMVPAPNGPRRSWPWDLNAQLMEERGASCPHHLMKTGVKSHMIFRSQPGKASHKKSPQEHHQEAHIAPLEVASVHVFKKSRKSPGEGSSKTVGKESTKEHHKVSGEHSSKESDKEPHQESSKKAGKRAVKLDDEFEVIGAEDIEHSSKGSDKERHQISSKKGG